MNSSGAEMARWLPALWTPTPAPLRATGTELRDLYAESDANFRSAELRRDSARTRGTRPSLPLAAYAGTYADSLRGEITIRHETGRLVARYGTGITGPLTHWHHDTFRAVWQDPALGNSFITFVLDASGKPRALVLEGVGEFGRRAGRPVTTDT